jgi:translation initiation factor IF-3
VIDDEGNNLGEMPTSEALEMAKTRQLDLIEVSPNAKPPVCRVMDYGKFQYQESKQKRLAQAKQKKVETKEVRMGIRTEAHDRDFKRSQVEKFLGKGDKVKIEIILKGREKAHQDLARKVILEFVALITVPYKVEEELKRFPGGFNILIIPQ